MIPILEQKRTPAQNRKLYWLFSRLGFDSDAIAECVYSWTDGRTRHTSEMTYMECQEGIRIMETSMRSARQNRAQGGSELDRARKKCLRSIFAYAELRGMEVDMDYVKGWACRAAGADRFNDISLKRLNSIYAEFCHKQREVKETLKY